MTNIDVKFMTKQGDTIDGFWDFATVYKIDGKWYCNLEL